MKHTHIEGHACRECQRHALRIVEAAQAHSAQFGTPADRLPGGEWFHISIDEHNLREIAAMVERGDLKGAWAQARRLDTAAREVIPDRTWEFLGGELIKRGR